MDSFKLPQGMTEFEEFSKEIILKSGLPDNDSIRFALATAIMHFPQPRPEDSMDYFVKILQRGAANQVAHKVIMDLKEKQQQEIAKQAEATAENAEPSDAKN